MRTECFTNGCRTDFPVTQDFKFSTGTKDRIYVRQATEQYRSQFVLRTGRRNQGNLPYLLPITIYHGQDNSFKAECQMFSWFCVLQPQASSMMNYYFWVYFRGVTNVTNGLNGRKRNKEIAIINCALFIKIALLLSWRQNAIQNVWKCSRS